MNSSTEKIMSQGLNLKEITHVYLIGIGGIGMSALARYFNQSGVKVSGYDKNKTPLTEQLVLEGINVCFEDEISTIPREFLETKKHKSLVIYTPAIPNDHDQKSYFINTNFKAIKRSVALGLIVNNTVGLAVAGTHGKTTTSSILSHIINDSGIPVTAFLGGIAANYNSNFIHSPSSKISVVEADEYDRSFLTLNPFGAIITSTDADHLDIYGDHSDLIQSFIEFSEQCTDVLVIHENVVNQFKNLSQKKIKTYGWNSTSDYHIISKNFVNGNIELDIHTPTGTLKAVKFNMPGRHNIENAIAALALGIEADIDGKSLAQSLESFKGIRRRFEFIIKNPAITFIDDYAHHPTELNATISACRELFPNKSITGIFQPHLYSRTRDFSEEFARSLEQLDELILLDIYPAREEPIPGITSSWLMSKINLKTKLNLTKPETLNHITNNRPEILITLGAGDVSQMVLPLKNLLK